MTGRAAPAIGRAAPAIVALVLLAVGCGGGEAQGPGAIDTCEGLVVDAVDLMQAAIDELDGMSIEDIGAAEQDAPQAFTELERRGELLEARAVELGCTGDRLGELLAVEVNRLTAQSLYGQAFIESVRSGDVAVFGE